MRRPISLVRNVTRCAITLYTPRLASSRRQDRESCQQHQRALAIGDRPCNARGKRLRLQQREIRVHRSQRLAHDRQHRRGADVRPHEDVREGFRPLQAGRK
jgi:hypothetical protein